MAVGGGGVEALFYRGPITPGDAAIWQSPGVLEDAASGSGGGGAPGASIVPTYYVSPTGSDSNTGTSSSTPWQTIAKVNASTFSPGSSILFQGGQTFSGAIVSPSGGTPAQPITFGSYGGGQATISSGTSNGFTSTNFPGVIVRDLTFTGSSSSNHGIIFQNTLSGNIHLQNVQAIGCNVSGYGRCGIFVTGGAGSVAAGYDDVIIKNCTVSGCCGQSFSGNGTSGIDVQNPPGFGIGTNPVSFNNVVIENCISHDNTGTSDTNWTGSGIFVSQCNNGVLRNCLAYNNGANANNTLSNGGPTGIWFGDATNVIIDGCVSHNNHTANNFDGDGFAIDEGVINGTIANCLSYSNDGIGYLIDSGTDAGISINDRCSIINCVSYNDGASATHNTPCGILLGGIGTTLTNCVVANNSVYQSNAAGIGMIINGTNAATITGLVSNNQFIVSSTQKIISSTANPTGLLFQGNKYTGSGGISWNGTSYSSAQAWMIATSQEAATTASPLEWVSGSIDVLDYSISNTGGWTIPLAAGSSHHNVLAVTPVAIDSTIASDFGSNGMFGAVDTNLANSAIFIGYGANAFGPAIGFGKTRTANSTAPSTAVTAGDGLGGFYADGADGSHYQNAAQINFLADPNGTVSAGHVPGYIQFMTASNSAAPVERLGIDRSGNVILGTSGSILKIQSELDFQGTSATFKVNGTDVLDYNVSTANMWTMSSATGNIPTLRLTSGNTTGTAISLTNTSSGGHEFWFYSSGSGNFPGHFGIFDLTAGITPFDLNGANGNVTTVAGGVFGWSLSATSPQTGPDTGISRSAAGVIAIGNGTAADASATIQAKTKAGAPTTSDVPAGTWALIRDTTNNTTKMYYNNAGTLQSVALV